MFRRELSPQERDQIDVLLRRHYDLTLQIKSLQSDADAARAVLFSFITEEPGTKVDVPTQDGELIGTLAVDEKFVWDENVLADLIKSGLAPQVEHCLKVAKRDYDNASHEDQLVLNAALTRKPGAHRLRVKSIAPPDKD